MSHLSTKFEHGPAHGRDCESCGYGLSGLPDQFGAVRCPECGHANLTVPDITGRHLDRIMHDSLKRDRRISYVLFAIGAVIILMLIPVLGFVGASVFGGIALVVWLLVTFVIDVGEEW
ncbi:MAG: hypothetical protein DHS20C14_04380 [Phycisphaeraceae bacterium]|nr:MAG: hypothetical protein DHS20C14_04380 [Phycisphaeraceae bacterium]